MDRIRVRQVLVALAVLAVIIVNGLANALPLNGLNTGEISDRFRVYFVPAGYVFAIWGVIYLGLLAYGVYQALVAAQDNPRLIGIGTPFILSCLANIAWLFLWHYEQFPLTLIAMLTLLACLIWIYLRLEIGRTRVSAGERWLVHLPFSIYLGWVTVATIANVTDVLDFFGWNGWGINPQLWALIMLVVATALAAVVAFTRRDAAYLVVLIWAFAGLGVKQAAAPLVATPAWVAAGLIALLAAAALLARKTQPVLPAASD
jgi:hypothetical protein